MVTRGGRGDPDTADNDASLGGIGGGGGLGDIIQAHSSTDYSQSPMSVRS